MANRYLNYDHEKWDKLLREITPKDSTPSDRIKALCQVQELAFAEMQRISDDLRAKLTREKPHSFQIIQLDQNRSQRRFSK